MKKFTNNDGEVVLLMTEEEYDCLSYIARDTSEVYQDVADTSAESGEDVSFLRSVVDVLEFIGEED